VNIVALIIFSLWFSLSVVRQFYSKKPLYMRHADVFRLIPSWRFFGPKPLVSDYRLHIGRLDESGGVHWEDITPFGNSRRLVQGVWNPERRLRKRLVYSIQMLEKQILKTDAQFRSSPPFRYMLDAARQPHVARYAACSLILRITRSDLSRLSVTESVIFQATANIPEPASIERWDAKREIE
jgi:hypothetical protein